MFLQPDGATLLASRHKRFAWLIPVNGRPPCPQPLTSGALLATEDDSQTSTSVKEAAVTHGTVKLIAWTPQDLLIFWLWLKDTQLNSIFGGVSLSITSMRTPKATTADNDEEEDGVPPPGKKIHYIILYHDALFSLRLRSYVGCFNPILMARSLSHESQAILINQSHNAEIRPRAVLKNARLLLLDENAKGLLIS